jgi:hypothetical protein
MKGRGTVKGILIAGSDGEEYLLGFTLAGGRASPTLSRRRADGTFELLPDGWVASKIAVAQLGVTGSPMIGPGMGKNFFLWMAFGEALKAFPPIPSWPTWSAEG